MLPISRWWRRDAEDLRLSRFRRVLAAAQRTWRYRPALEAAGLARPRDIARLSSIEEALYRLPQVEWDEFRAYPDGFENPSAPAPEPPRLRFPTNREIRAAVLGPRFVESSSVRLFEPSAIEPLRQFGPEAIAAPAWMLRRFAQSARYGDETIPSLTRAIIAFTGPGHGALEEADRTELWHAFELPIFEQCLGPDGELVAWECEAHDGLHLVAENAVVEQDRNAGLLVTSLTAHRHPAIRLAAGFSAAIADGPCDCNHPGPRLTGLAARPVNRSSDTIAALA